MTLADIQQLIQKKSLPDQPKVVDLIETHTAWVLLTKQYAYKIKKPVHFSFLDFSTLSQRKYYCERELALNQRLAPDIYLKVLPIKEASGSIHIGAGQGTIIDYCLLMKRMDNKKEMNLLLRNDLVTKKDLEAIAKQLVHFHKKAEVISKDFDAVQLKKDFADVRSATAVLKKHIDPKAAQTVEAAIAFANAFIDQHLSRFHWRQQEGYIRDVHGDLHSGNIFILEQPVIFDCLEFSDSLRQIDLLNEIAFLCMDLDYHGKPDLAEFFLEKYLSGLSCIFNLEDQLLFLFYKWYRAGIRMKVYCLGLHNGMEHHEKKMAIQQINNYYRLFEKYFDEMRIQMNTTAE